MRIDSYNLNFYSNYLSYQSVTDGSTALLQQEVQISHSHFSRDTTSGTAQAISADKSQPNSLEKELMIAKIVSYAIELLKKIRARQELDASALRRFSEVRAQAEVLKFQTQGRIVAADGRQVSVDLDFTLARSFLQVSRIENIEFTDPLVVSLDNTMPNFSESKFSFDIDADGEMDQISRLNSGWAFLALDHNKNGKIDDGSELFGAKSGDGFGELSKFDDDKNGWIDERDEIFHRLQIWRTDHGSRELVAVGEVGIGAIFLGSQQGQFSFNAMQTNENLAQLRSGGFFLYESGKAGLMMQVDMAKFKESPAQTGLNLPNLSLSRPQSTDESQTSQSKLSQQLSRLRQRLAALLARLASADENAAKAIRVEINAINSQITNLVFLAQA